MSCYWEASPLTSLECGQMYGHSTMVETNKGFQVIARPCALFLALAGCVVSPPIYLHISFYFSLILCIYQDKMFAMYTGRSLKQVGTRNILCTLYDLQHCSVCRKQCSTQSVRCTSLRWKAVQFLLPFIFTYSSFLPDPSLYPYFLSCPIPASRTVVETWIDLVSPAAAQ